MSRRRVISLGLALAALLLQLVVVYAPSGVGEPPFPSFDKVVHVGVFALPVFFAVLARLPAVPVVAVMALHAPLSEVVQHELLTQRSGDPWDAVADLVGVGLGALVAALVHRRVTGPQADRW